MSERAQAGPGTASGVGPASSTQSSAPPRGTPSLWVGWIWFAGTMMMLLGLFNVIEGLVALFKSRYYVVGPQGLLAFNLTGWGWIHLIIGALAVIAGLALLTGATWARITAVVLAVLNAVAQLAFLSAYPVWGTIVIALDVVVIWAIVVRGDEAKQETW
jgi:hypothetical protein